jgi:predicted metal-dependent phosphoesterase TrpH
LPHEATQCRPALPFDGVRWTTRAFGSGAPRAKSNGVELLALTDHDELGGLTEARATATEIGLRFVDGVEVSISWGDDQTVHIVALGIDPLNARI